jgi:hypothetical protein
MLGLGCIENKRHMALTNKLFLSISHPSRSRNVFIDRSSFLLEDILRFQVCVQENCLMKIISGEEVEKKIYFLSIVQKFVQF